VPRPVLVIREVDQLARRAKWRTCDLAEALGISTAMLNRLRAGTHAPSREVLSAILRAFGTNPQVRDLVLHYLEHELPLAQAGRLEAAPRGTQRADDLRALDDAARTQVRAFVTHFLRRSLTSGEGLCIVSSKSRQLSAAVSYVRSALDAQGISVIVIPGNTTPGPSLLTAALAAALLIVERVDFAAEGVRALLAQRAAARKPVVTTSARRLDGSLDAPVVLLDATSSPSPAHAAA